MNADFFNGWKINLLGVIVAVIGGLELLSQSNLVPSEYNGWILFAVGVLTIILRTFFTAAPVKFPFMRR